LRFYYIDLSNAIGSADAGVPICGLSLFGEKSSVLGAKSLKFGCSNSGFLLKLKQLVGFVREFRVGTAICFLLVGKLESGTGGEADQSRRIGTWRIRSDGMVLGESIPLATRSTYIWLPRASGQAWRALALQAVAALAACAVYWFNL
jgi:hypothetical protein